MATTKNITMKQFNGTDYDTLYPKTQGSQITGAVPIASGGTGGTTAKAGMYNLLNGMSAIAPATNDLFPFKDVSGSTSGLVTLTNLITAMGNNGVITTSNLSTQASNLGFSKIQTGSYVGTGTYGASNPCSLTFNFIPYLLIIGLTGTYQPASGIVALGIFFPLSETYEAHFIGGGNMSNSHDNSMYAKLVNNTIYYYSNSAINQMNFNTANANGPCKYEWFCIGK